MMLPTRCDIFCLQGCQKSRNLRAEKNGTSSIRFSSALGYLCGRGWLHSSLLSHKLLQGAKAEKDRSQGANSLQHLCPSCCLASDQQDLHLHSPPPLTPPLLRCSPAQTSSLSAFSSSRSPLLGTVGSPSLSSALTLSSLGSAI